MTKAKLIFFFFMLLVGGVVIFLFGGCLPPREYRMGVLQGQIHEMDEAIRLADTCEQGKLETWELVDLLKGRRSVLLMQMAYEEGK